MKAIADWTTRKIFSYVHGNHLVYNTCWEDPRLDREAMELGPDDEVVLITSAGCNALDYALDHPRRVYAVDMNFRQNALLELKLAGIRRLEYSEFFSLFGDGGHPDFPALYHRRLRGDLTPPAQGYWDRRLHYFSRPTPNASFYHRGTTGVFARMMVHYFKAARIHADMLRIFSAATVEQQREIYFNSVRDKFWRSPLKRALETDVALSMLGVPKAQREHLGRTCACTVADFMEDCVEAVLTRLPTADNYFWRVYLFGAYTPECCPEYLRPGNFERLKGGLADHIQIHTGNLTHFLRGHAGSFSRFVLLDHMDWLSHAHPELLAAEWQAIMDKAREGARILWRSAGAKVDFVDPLVVSRNGRSNRVGDLLRYDEATAAACHERDRVHTYGSFYIAHLAG
jgi:S-adenosylmethionine-diacylglycerol 3-amino-3-carboxypropyl transferase